MLMRGGGREGLSSGPSMALRAPAANDSGCPMPSRVIRMGVVKMRMLFLGQAGTYDGSGYT
jgi:hypothetical protein